MFVSLARIITIWVQKIAAEEEKKWKEDAKVKKKKKVKEPKKNK